MHYVLVFLGGGLGATLRHVVNVTCARWIGTAFPYGTFIINITGSTVMGLIAGYRVSFQLNDCLDTFAFLYREVAVKHEALAIQSRRHECQEYGGWSHQRHHSKIFLMSKAYQSRTGVGYRGAACFR